MDYEWSDGHDASGRGRMNECANAGGNIKPTVKSAQVNAVVDASIAIVGCKTARYGQLKRARPISGFGVCRIDLGKSLRFLGVDFGVERLDQRIGE